MANISQPIKFSSDGRVAFDPANHTYLLDGERYLTGVTSYIERYKTPFDSDHWSSVIAEREGVTREVILHRWKDKADRSKHIGHLTHQVFEDFANTGIIDHSGEYAKQYVAEKFINDFFLTGRLEPVVAESIVHNEEIASMRDMVVRDQKNRYFIIDWKTNEEIKSKNYGKFMLSPFDKVPDHTLAHYSIQLKIYDHLSTDYPIAGTYIVHIGEHDYNFIKPIPIILPNL